MKTDNYIEIVTTPIGGFNLMPQKILLHLQETLSKYYTKVSISIIHSMDDLEHLVKCKPDLVISGIKYLGFDKNAIKRNAINKLWFSEYLDQHNIAYTGSTKEAIELEFDKSKAKAKVKSCGLNTAASFIAGPNVYTEKNIPLSYPLFVKPLFEGDSRGIDSNSLVHNYLEFENKVESIFEHQNTVSLVEKYLCGKEYTVAIVQGSEDDAHQIYPIELQAQKNANGDRILGFDDKVADEGLALKIEDQHVKDIVSQLAIDCFKALGAKGYGRIDIKMDEKGIPYFLEANLIPGLGFGYLYRCYHINTGLRHDQMLLDIVGNVFGQNLEAAKQHPTGSNAVRGEFKFPNISPTSNSASPNDQWSNL